MSVILPGLLPALAPPLFAQRQVEDLGRGVIAVRKSSTEAFISWRLLGLDPTGVGFNLYRSTNGGAPVKLNASVLSTGTNYIDNTANLTVSNAYVVHPVVDGVEQAPSASFTLPANAEVGPVIRIPLQAPHDRRVHNVWPGDLDGDGEYELIACLTGSTTGQTQKIAAYKLNGTFLWDLDFGPNSIDSDNIYVSSATIAAGQWDGVTVYDLDGDGRAEVIVKSANGVRFGDGATLTFSDNVTQFISVLEGQTGGELDRAVLPNPWQSLENRPLGTLFGVGYPDGVRPSLMIHAKTRKGDGNFHQVNSAWDYRGGNLTQRWSNQWEADDPSAPPTNHQMRILDIDGDGKDEMFPGMYALNYNGTLRYNLGLQGIVHGDRFHISDLNPNRAGLEHYGIQQNNPSGRVEYFTDANTGQLLWDVNIGSIADAARGMALDIDPNYPGSEVWSFYGLRSATGTLIANDPTRPYPNLGTWWDGDLHGDCVNTEVVDKWNYTTMTTSRLLTAYHYGANSNSRSVPAFLGDIYGDWREELIYENANLSEFLVFTTSSSSTTRLYTLAQNPAYRNCLTVKGYLQSNHPDYFLGNGMSTPPTPDIVYTPSIPPLPAPAAPSGLAAVAASGTQINLVWSDTSSNEYGFKIERSSDGSSFAPRATVGVSSTSYSDTGLAPSTTYYYRVRAYHSDANSAYSNPSSATTPAAPPVAPTDVTAESDINRVALSWGASAGATSYNVKRSNNSGGPYTTLASPAVAGHTDITAAAGTTYYYVVSAVNANGESANSSERSGTSVAAGTLQQDSGADGILSVETENYSTNVSQGNHSWAVDATPGYSGAGAMASMPNSGTNINTGYTTTSPRLDFQINFTKTGTHYVWIRGRTGPNGVDDDSGHAGIDGVANTTSDRMTFSSSWAWRNTTMDGPVATFYVTSPGVHTVNIWMREDGLIVDKLLLTSNASYVPSGTGPEESAREGDVTVPATPSGPSATAVSSSRIDVSWTASTGATSYNVKRATTSGGPYTTVASGVTSTGYSNNGLSASTTYNYVVSAVNSAGESADSAQVNATTQTAAPSTPTFVGAGSASSGAGSVTAGMPSGLQTEDSSRMSSVWRPEGILLLFVETAAQASSLSNQNGGTWSAVTGALQSTGAAGGTNGAQLSVFWSRYNGSQGAPSISDSGNHQLAQVVAIRGAASSGTPWDVVGGNVEATSDTTGNIPGATTTVSDTLVVVAVAGNLPDSNGTSQFSGWTNSSLTSMTERTDNTTNSGNGGALGIATGGKASAGAYGATTVTHGSSAAKAMVSIAIKN
jgi:fibronectin type 3 domain-containing protein